MDPFSTDGELVNIHTAFVQGQYSAVVSDFSPSDFSSSNTLPVQILQYRAQCALGQYDDVISAISDSDAKSTPDLAAARTYASYLKGGAREDGDAVTEAERLAEQHGENLSVELLCGAILARAGKSEQAVALLQKHQGSLDAVALLAQIHLGQNRTDLALKEAKNARTVGGDALLVNLIESWVGMRTVSLKHDQRPCVGGWERGIYADSACGAGRRKLPKVLLRLRGVGASTQLQLGYQPHFTGRQ